jgi:hypothetical protein
MREYLWTENGIDYHYRWTTFAGAEKYESFVHWTGNERPEKVPL